MGRKTIDRTGEININNQGLKMKIVKYRNNSDIDVEFLDDGYISEHKQYKSFETGKIENPNFKHSTTKNKVGEIGYNKFGSKMIIVEYRTAKDIDIYFPEYDWTARSVQYSQFKNGTISCPYERRTYGVGYLGEGKYKTKQNGKATKCYITWKDMLKRCYDSTYHKKHPTYKDCEVYNKWLNFQNFAKWYYENYYEIEGKRMELDKDILVKGNKIYSPNTCVFAPHDINVLFTKSDKARGKYPIGVQYDKQTGKFRAKCNVYDFENKNKKIYLGLYNTPEEAFNSYKQFKEKNIKEVADYYKNKIPTKLYQAMYNYQVEITD